MKKSLRIGCIVLCAVLATGCSGSDHDKDTQNTDMTETAPTADAESKAEVGNSGSEKDIGMEQAKAIALSDAGLNKKDVSFIKEEQETDDGKIVYDIEFYNDNKEYDYEIEAATGNIISKDYDVENHKVQSDNSTGSSNTITMEKAKKIALKKAGLTEKDGTWKKEKQDRDDGHMIYELEFISKEMEYEFEIDAESGNILDFEKESVYE